MSDREYALTLAGYILAHPKHADIAKPIMDVIDRVLNPVTPVQTLLEAAEEWRLEIAAHKLAEANTHKDRCKTPESLEKAIADDVIPAAFPQGKSDDDKIAEYLTANPVVKIKRTSNMSPENREKAAQRMRDMQAKKKTEKDCTTDVTITVEGKPLDEVHRLDDFTREIKPKPRQDTSIDALIANHSGYAGKRDDSQLVDSDWPDIKARLVKGTDRKSIAGDYDVGLEDLEFFIASNERREAKQPPGEARAPL